MRRPTPHKPRPKLFRGASTRSFAGSRRWQPRQVAADGIPAGLVTVINTFLQLFNAKPIPKEGGVGDTKLLYDKPVVYPDKPICRN